jgi:peptidoglycan hydrolase-like protein with peptidoglycan-binding domain
MGLLLIWAGFNVGATGADGIYGKMTSAAVLKYKKAVGLTPNDGNFGKKSLEKAKTFKK